MKHIYQGLSEKEVTESRQKFGTNALSPPEIETFWDKLWDNFKNPIIIILLVALLFMTVLSIFGLTEWYEAVAIGIAVALATLVSTFSEFKNESAFQKLQEEASQIMNHAFRDGNLIEISVNDVVKGDYVLLQSGDKIPADGFLIAGDLKVNQASLTGESDNISKKPLEESEIANHPLELSSQHGLFRGAVVDEGEAVMLVQEVGDTSFYGKLAQELSQGDDRLSPLQVKLGGLAGLISKFGYIAAILIFFTFLGEKALVENNFDSALIAQYFSDWRIFVPDMMDAMVLAIIIVVAAIPEGLPMMIAIVLSLNMHKLLIDKVLVRRLLGIETAGSLNILFSDKTGTITKGQLKPRVFISGSGKQFNNFESLPEPLKDLLTLSILENTSAFIEPDGTIIGGNASERALISFVQGAKSTTNGEVVEENKILFNSAWKFSAAQVRLPSEHPIIKKEVITLVKGAPEVVLEQCKHYIDEEGKRVELTNFNELTAEMDQLADSGIRLIGLAISEETIQDGHQIPNNRVMVGIMGIADEVREESKNSIEAVQKAGIQVVMITGDRQGTAEAIAKDVGLITSENDISIQSSDLNSYSDDEVKKIIPNLRVIARALPTDKSRLVRLSKMLGKVVGMTGDGVNDSAALKQADVGVAMGSGSEVSKEAGDIVILDDNFKSINNAIRYGRTIFKSIRKFVVFQLTVNVAAVLTAFLGPLFGIDFPLTIIQLLWINIIMDTLAAIAFGGEPALMRYMEEPPVQRDEDILTKDMKISILTSGLYITAMGFFFLKFEPIKDLFIRNGAPDPDVHLSAFFSMFIFLIIFNGFSVRTSKINLFDHITKNTKFLSVMGFIITLQIVFTYIGGDILRTRGLTLTEWAIVFGLALTIIPVQLIRKSMSKSRW